jgi:3-oxoacyl-(acyl-carrier-protein) synthase
LGASGAVDLIATILAMEHNAVPPMINVEVPDPEGLNYTIGKALEKKIIKALVISRGRGGINTVIVIEKKEVA